MTTIETILHQLEKIKDDQTLDLYTIDKCIKLVESHLPKEIWELHRQYDEGWIACLRDKNM